MIVNKTTKLFQDKIDVKYNWLDDNWIYVETGTELADVIKANAPRIELVFDESGNLVEVTPTATS